jgi:outer membrane protein
MNVVRCMLGILVIASLVGVGSAADLKVGFINSQEIFVRYQGTEDAQRKFDEEKQRLEEEIESKKQEIEDLRADLERKSLLMSEETKKERLAELQRKEQEFQQLYFDAFGEGGSIVKLNAELTQPIIEKMNLVLNELGESDGYDIIFDVAPGGIVYANEGFDLTDRVLDELNAMVKLPAEETTEDSKP